MEELRLKSGLWFPRPMFLFLKFSMADWKEYGLQVCTLVFA
jgi:hypothetical protein